MSKVTVKELKELAKQFSDTNVFIYNGLEVEIKQYLSIEKKKEIVEDVVYRCLAQTEDEVQLIHSYLSHISKITSIIRQYTNVNLPEDNYTAYDLIKKIKLDQFVLENIPETETDEIDKMINRFIEDLRFNQMHSVSVETIIKQALDKLIGKIPSIDEAKDFISNASKEIEGFDPSKLDFIKDFLAMNKGENIG